MQQHGRHRSRRDPRPRRTKIVAAFFGAALSGGLAFAATQWLVGLNDGSSGQGQAASIQNLSITATSGALTNQLYPGGIGDVTVRITNPNGYPVTITAVSLPAATSYASAYSDSALTSAVAGCAAGSPSYVTWNGSAGSHTLTSPLTVGANGTLTVTFTNGASMGLNAPAACANGYLKMPSLGGVTASGGAATATAGPATVSWS
jgi:hypothetical protein